VHALAVGGGKPKMRWYFKQHGWPTSSILDHVPESEEDQATVIDTSQARTRHPDCSVYVSNLTVRSALAQAGMLLHSVARQHHNADVLHGAAALRASPRSAPPQRRRRLQDWKSQKYQDLIGSGAVQARPGVLRLMDEARAHGLKLAVCSAATKSSVVFTLTALLGEQRFGELDCFLAGDDVKEKKPSPTIYLQAAGAARAPRARTWLLVQHLSAASLIASK
jgi:phosphoglycolate phosphatase-like HAD superfamily hydrolase